MPKTESLQINMGDGIESPAQTNGTLPAGFTIRPTSDGKMSYAQNINVQNDKYGRGIVLPGPYINSFSQALSQPIYYKATDPQQSQIWFANGNTTTLDVIKGLASGSTPTYDNSHTVTVTSATAGIVDMEYATLVGAVPATSDAVYVVFTNTSTAAGWVTQFQGSPSSTPTPGASAPLTTAITGNTPFVMIRTQFNGNIYIGNSQTIDMVTTNTANSWTVNSVTKAAIGPSSQAIPLPWFITAMGEWNKQLVVAANNQSPGDFSQRNSVGQSRIFFFDAVNTPTGSYSATPITSPSHYISTLLLDLSGNLLAFGGVDEGRTTIYQFNGYGFDSIFSYIGDMPRSRHSVCFDSVGRLVWVTADGRLCRWDRQNDIFDQLGIVGGNAQNGGICTNLQASGYDFLVAADAWLSAVDLKNFKAGGSGASDNAGRPLAVTGLRTIPQQSVIRNVTPGLHKALESGEKIEVRLYPSNYINAAGSGNGYVTLGYMDYAVDGAITSKNIRTLQPNQTAFAIGYAWETTATNTAPGIVSTSVEYNKITTL